MEPCLFYTIQWEQKSTLANLYTVYLFKYTYISTEKTRRIYSRLLIGGRGNEIRIKGKWIFCYFHRYTFVIFFCSK